MLLLSFALLATVASGSAVGRELWVDRNALGGECSDTLSREQVSATRPWCTLGASGDKARPGDVVTVRSGIYREAQQCSECDTSAVLQVINPGLAGQPIRYRAAPDERVVIAGGGEALNGIVITGLGDKTPRHVEIEGFEVRDFVLGNCVFLNRVSDIVLRDLDVHGCRYAALELHRTDRVTVADSRVHDNPMSNFTSAIDLLECGKDNAIRGNFIWNNTDEDPREFEGHGVIMDLCPEGASTLIENNVLWNNEGWCLVAFESGGSVIRNNVCWRNGQNPFSGEISLLGEGHQVYNNILVPLAERTALLLRERDDYRVDLSRSRADGNLIWAPDNAIAIGWSTGSYATAAAYPNANPYGWGEHAVIAAPRLSNPEAADFRPMADSPAVDAGRNTNAAATDILGTGRTRSTADPVDVGAYELPAPVTGLEPTLSVTDSDGDGLPDDWERANFQTLSRDGVDDFDNDGLADLDEFLRGRNPAEPIAIDEGQALWVDKNSLGGVCSDRRERQEVGRTTPWCTLAAAGINARAGDVITVRGGIYNETQRCEDCMRGGIAVLQVMHSGTAERPIRFKAAAGEQVILDGSDGPVDGILITRTNRGLRPRFIEINGFELRNFASADGITGNCVMVLDTSDVTLRNLDVHDCSGSAVEFHRTARSTLEYSRVYDNAMDGYTSAVDLYQCGSGNTVRGNFIYDNRDTHPLETEGHGIIQDVCPDGASALIENNVIWGNEGWCIVVLESDRAQVRNNTCWRNGAGREFTGELSLLGERIRVFNNILVPRAGQTALLMREREDYPIDLDQSDVDGNLIWAEGNNGVAVGWSTGLYATALDYPRLNPYQWGQNAVIADPELNDPAGGDFLPRAGSPAIDAAVDGQAPSLDILGRRRPFDGNSDGTDRADIGAFERGASTLLPEAIFLDQFERPRVTRPSILAD